LAIAVALLYSTSALPSGHQSNFNQICHGNLYRKTLVPHLLVVILALMAKLPFSH
jgi:hypothetical protein